MRASVPLKVDERDEEGVEEEEVEEREEAVKESEEEEEREEEREEEEEEEEEECVLIGERAKETLSLSFPPSSLPFSLSPSLSLSFPLGDNTTVLDFAFLDTCESDTSDVRRFNFFDDSGCWER